MKGESPQMNERERMLREIQELEFTAIDLQLFLDTHPDDRRALADYISVSQALKTARERYERAYGPLVGFGFGLEELNQGYRWLDYWPWEDLGGNN